MSSLYSQNLSFSPVRAAISSQIRTNSEAVDNEYLAELLAERQKLVPFMQVFPVCCRLIDQEIIRVSGMISNVYGGGIQRGRPNPMAMMTADHVGGEVFSAWKGFQNELLQERQEMAIDWSVPPGNNIPVSFPVKKVLRLEIPVDKYPTFNFVGRLLGPRGNSLKRVEATTGCRIFIRGKGSIKDTDKQESLIGRPGYEHLSDPLHILIEAEFPINVIDVQLKQAKEIVQELLTPVDESQDVYKRQQLRELALINNTLREESPQTRGGGGSQSPFSSPGIKRAKPGWE